MSRFTFASLVAAAALAAASSAAFAHGPQMQISRDPATGKIVTHQVIDTHAAFTSYTPATRVFVMPLEPTGAESYVRPDTQISAISGLPEYLSGPGVSYQYDGVAGSPGGNWAYSGSSTVPNLTASTFTYTFTTGLMRWNGSTFVDAGATQLEQYRGAFVDTKTTADGGGNAGISLAPIASQSGNPHSGVSYRLLGDGVSSTSASANGIYMVGMRIDNSAAGVEPSDAFYFILHKPYDVATATSVANLFAGTQGIATTQVQAVPEPASVGLLVGAAGLLLRRGARRA